jgi:hypothetical protein
MSRSSPNTPPAEKTTPAEPAAELAAYIVAELREIDHPNARALVMGLGELAESADRVSARDLRDALTACRLAKRWADK